MIFIVPIEPIDQRYTKQWYENIPNDLQEKGLEVTTIDGLESTNNTTSGAFLNFAFTNAYKASQIQAIALHFQNGKVKPGDKFLVTDAWNFAVTAIRYMSDLLEIPVEIHGIWHAGHYDPSDILGMKMGDWAVNQEIAWYNACDYNYFATEFHKEMFLNNLNIVDRNKAIRSGQPHKQNITRLANYINDEKKDVVMWPHRYNSDKQPEIAVDLSDALNVVITQKMSLSKEGYYKTLGSAKVIFSCALHENLGISVMEGCLAGAIPVVPDRCSYSEMYLNQFKYPSEWTSSYDNYLTNKQLLLDFIQDKIVNYEKYQKDLEHQRGILALQYLNADIMYSKLAR
jgi:hypothetical protein